MDHPNISVLIDYLRNLLLADGAARAAAHVQECDECRVVLDQLMAIQQFATEEAHFVPSVESVEAAKQAFGGTPPAGSFASIPMRLLFDSFAAPAFSGLRAGQRSERQLSFESGEWRLDMAVDKPYGTAETSVVGQIAQPAGTGSAAVQIRVRQGKRVVRQTASNEQGEFSLTFIARNRTALEIQTPGKGPLLSISAKYFLDEV